VKKNKPIQGDILTRLSTTAGQIFGNSAFEKTQVNYYIKEFAGLTEEVPVRGFDKKRR